jgi:WXG100 family type VII secretion target
MLKVNFAALDQAGTDIGQALGAIDAQLAELKAAAAPLVETWDGAAKDAYFQRQTTWTNSAERIKAILGDIQGAVVESSVDYRETEKRATNLFE